MDSSVENDIKRLEERIRNLQSLIDYANPTITEAQKQIWRQEISGYQEHIKTLRGYK